MHKPPLLKRMGIKVVVSQLNHEWLAEFGVLALSRVMLVQMMLCDTHVGDLEMCMAMMILRDLLHTCACT